MQFDGVAPRINREVLSPICAIAVALLNAIQRVIGEILGASVVDLVHNLIGVPVPIDERHVVALDQTWSILSHLDVRHLPAPALNHFCALTEIVTERGRVVNADRASVHSGHLRRSRIGAPTIGGRSICYAQA